MVTKAREMLRGKPRKMGLRRALELARRHADRLRHGSIDPERFARSVGAGVFLGVLPIHGFQTAVWALLVALLPLEPLLTWLWSWIGNAATAVPITWLELQIGAMLSTGSWRSVSLKDVAALEPLVDMVLQVAVGSAVLGTCLGTVGYLGARAWAKHHRGAARTVATTA